jgi:tetratricopeptide (TPR) repeat protein
MRKLLATAVAVFAAVLSYAQTEIQVQVHNVVAEDEQFNVTFIIEGEAKSSDFSWSPGDDFQLLWGPQQGRSTSVQMINGKTTKSVQTTYSYVLRPTKVGKFTIAKAVAKVKGKEITSSPVTVEVVASGSSASRPSQGSAAQQGNQQRQSSNGIVQDDDIFLTLTLSRTNVVVGEPVTAVIKLYQRVNVAGFESAVFPTFNGFWSQELESPTNIEFTRETYDGKIYNSAILRKFILIPQQQGQVKIDPAELVCLVNVRVSAGGASIFDGFFDDYRTVRKKVLSKPVTVNVAPLPAGAPASFGGGVGEFAISAKISRDTLKTHEAASLVLTLSGRGNVSLLEAPKVNFPPDMEVYDTKVSEKIEKGGISGSRTYEYPFIPRSYGDFVIEPVRYSYYDVDRKQYVTLETPPIPVVVEKGNETDNGGVVVSGSVPKDVKNLGSDIRFINVKAHGLGPKGDYLLGSALFWILILLILAAAAICWASLRHLAARRADVVGTRTRKATKMALKRLQLAGTFLKQNLYTAFYEELHKALLGFISDKLAIPAAELSRDRMTEALKAGHVDQGTIDTFIGILDACEFARYAPDAGHEAMAAHYESAVDVISSIDSDMKSNKSVSKGVLSALVMLMVLPAAVEAQEKDYADSLWNAANQAYVEGRWADAVEGYGLIEGMGLESAALYCNAGDAYFKDGNVAKAILYYERALKLDPSYSDARFNLELLNSGIQDRIEPVPEFVLKTWAKDVCYIMDSNAWAVCFLVFFALTLAMLLLFILSPSVGGRRTGFFTAIVMLVLAVSSLTFSAWQKRDNSRADDAVVMRPVTSVKSSPSSESSTDLFILHEGTKVKVVDAVGSWNNIELADGRQGWIRSADIERI